MTDLVILGGGASGLMAAVSAASFLPPKSITLVESGPRVGKKLLTTGNGRCNLTNLDFSFSRYHGAPECFLRAVIQQFSPKDTLAFFQRLGLLCRRDSQGRCYPYNNQASAVLDVLRRFLAEQGVEELCGFPVSMIRKKRGGYELQSGSQTLFAKRLILAAGGKAAPSTGSDGSGLALAKKLGLKSTPVFPSLVPVRVQSPFLKSLKGVRCAGKAALLADGTLLKEETGEIQFTDQGLSGICLFNLSRFAGEFYACGSAGGQKRRELCISLDLAPDLESPVLTDFFHSLSQNQPRLSLEQMLSGVLNKRLCAAFLKSQGLLPSQACAALSGIQTEKISAAIKDWRFPVSGVLGWQQAQVTAGGLITSQFAAETLEAKAFPGLYACGELLDIDGDCGGYNLQWAWSSGFTAGKHAAQSLQKEKTI